MLVVRHQCATSLPLALCEMLSCSCKHIVCDKGIRDKKRVYLSGVSIDEEVACKAPCKHPALNSQQGIMSNALEWTSA